MDKSLTRQLHNCSVHKLIITIVSVVIVYNKELLMIFEEVKDFDRSKLVQQDMRKTDKTWFCQQIHMPLC